MTALHYHVVNIKTKHETMVLDLLINKGANAKMKGMSAPFAILLICLIFAILGQSDSESYLPFDYFIFYPSTEKMKRF